ncbi:MAG: hydroxymethylglutaryl-CoA reductase, degradative [Methanobacteriota archaeon]|nr:MAG: hydroxymethylglutaryl-CoA reductase, degradative [Euryarchaeota archaeon]
MPVSNSRVPGFHRLSVEQRRQLVAELAGLDENDLAAWAATGELSEEVAEHMIENVVGTMSLPIGLATNFIIDGSHFLIPYVIEESSVVAAASNMAKRCIGTGGFRTNCDASIMIAQVQILELDDIAAAISAVDEKKSELIAECNRLDSTIVKLGGGCKDLICRHLDSDSGPMLVVHLFIDCLDAMGANAVNTMAELVAPSLGRITGGKVNLRIMSNLATHRMARVEARWSPQSMADESEKNGERIIQGIIEAYNFACADPYRAATHNKGVMNAISAVAVACGQDWRAIEAGCHAWVAYEQGKYGSMTRWSVDEEGYLVGAMECPMAVGIVGGASKVHPVSRTNLKLLGVESAAELAGILVCAGLAQNLGALRALSTSGIQSGHMKLHAENMALSAGAVGDEVGQVAEIMRRSNSPITQTAVTEALEKLRQE